MALLLSTLPSEVFSSLLLLLLLPTFTMMVYLILDLYQWRLENTIHSPRQINLVTLAIFMSVFIAFAVLFFEPQTWPIVDDASPSSLRFLTFRVGGFLGQSLEYLEEYERLGWEWGLDFVDLGREGTVRVVVIL